MCMNDCGCGEFIVLDHYLILGIVHILATRMLKLHRICNILPKME